MKRGAVMNRRVLVVAPVWLGSLLAFPLTAGGQSAATTHLAAARVQVHALHFDSAALLVRGALDSASGASRSDRVEAWLLLGVVEFYQGHDSATATDFRHALGLDPKLEATELSRYDSALVVVLETERRALTTSRAVPAIDSNIVVDCTRRCSDIVYPQVIEFRPNWTPVEGFDVLHNLTGFMLVRFITDMAGGVRPGSIAVVMSTVPLPFKQSAQDWLDALARARFRPARTGAGRPASVLLEGRVSFERGHLGYVTITGGRTAFVPVGR